MSSLEERLKAHAERTGACLADLMATAANVPPRLRDAMQLAVLGGGKRFRPFLLIESAALFGVPAEKAVRAAAALECLHCYSLVHDDLPAMDNDLLRRGQPTVWAAFDDWTAILAGDALLTLSFEILAMPATHHNPEVRSTLVAELAQAGGPAGMVGGQMLDLSSEKLSHPADPTLGYIRQLQAMKTGALIRFACEAGAILGEAEATHRGALRSFGENLGIVFQIADDLLDATGDSATVGKATGKDAAAGKATQVSLLGIEDARRYLNETAALARAQLEPFGEAGHMLLDAVAFAADRAR